MLDHVTIRASDLEASRRFYSTALRALPADLRLEQAAAGHAPTRHLHVAFAAASREEVDAFWRRGLDAGYRSDGAPGLRRQYAPDYYGAFLLDPDGNSVEAVTGHRETAEGPPIDHLWLGVRDLAASRRFYEDLASALGLRVADASLPGLVSVAAGNRHLMLVADGRPPTENVRLAFPAAHPDEWIDPDGNDVEAVTRNR